MAMAFQQIPSLSAQTQKMKNDIIGSVRRALEIMELLASCPDGLNAKQISYRLRLNVGTCYHLLNTLIVSDYVVKDPDTLLFRPSGKIAYTLYKTVSPAQIVSYLMPHVQSLQEKTHETTYLSVWNGKDIFLAAIDESPLSVRVKSLTLGYDEANHAIALGKAILAYLDESQLDNYLIDHGLERYTSNTITSDDLLKKHLMDIRRHGYSLDSEEFLTDVCCIGAPIFDAEGQVIASIAISLPSTRYHSLGDTLIPYVRQSAKAATRTLSILGYIRSTVVNEGESCN